MKVPKKFIKWCGINPYWTADKVTTLSAVHLAYRAYLKGKRDQKKKE